MTKQRNALRAGIFILASIAGVIAIIIGIAGLENFTSRWNTHTVRFKLSDDIGGLAPGDPVRLGGYKVGVVDSIQIEDLEAVDQGGEPSIVVRFTMPEKYVLRTDAQVAIQETVTGSTWLNMSSLGAGEPLAEGIALPGGPSTTTRLLRTLEKVAPEVQGLIVDVRTKTLPEINATVTKVKDNIDPVVGKYMALSDRASETMVEMRDILGDTKGDIRKTMSNLSAATGTVKDKLPGILDKLDVTLASTNNAIDKAIVVLEDLKPTMANARDITDSIRSIVVGNRGKIEDMIASLKATGDNLKNATAEIRRSPWRLLYKPRPNEMANLNLYDAARQFSQGASDLNDAATSLRDALNRHDLTEEELQSLLKQLDGTFEHFNEVENDLWQKVKE
jgi:ABC-type transporter Mla subunit MlaD